MEVANRATYASGAVLVCTAHIIAVFLLYMYAQNFHPYLHHLNLALLESALMFCEGVHVGYT